VAGTRTNDVYMGYVNFSGQAVNWVQVKFSRDNAPLPRGGHSACLYNGNSLYIFGGHDEDNNKLQDLWALNIPNATWTKIDMSHPT
jgi:N-acetylneuraminic acid mutarotase